MKKTYTAKMMALLLAAALLLSACAAGTEGGQSAAPGGSAVTDAPPTAGGEDGSALRVGLIVSGTVNDNGWCASAYEGLLAIESRFGAEINYVENVGMSDVESHLINYGEDGYDVVFCHGFEYADSVVKIGPSYPDTWFVGNSADRAQEPNVLSVNQNNLEKGFLAGLVAALVTESKIIGVIGGTDIPAVQMSLEGAEKAAHYIDPEITVLTTITGDNEDTTAALEVAKAMCNQGADVLIPVLGSAGLATLTAAGENDALVVGTNSDMHEFGPELVVTSSMAGFIDSMPAVIQALVDGTLEAKIYNFGIAEDVVKLTPFYQFEEILPQETLDKIQQTVADIKSGALVVE